MVASHLTPGVILLPSLSTTVGDGDEVLDGDDVLAGDMVDSRAPIVQSEVEDDAPDGEISSELEIPTLAYPEIVSPQQYSAGIAAAASGAVMVQASAAGEKDPSADHWRPLFHYGTYKLPMLQATAAQRRFEEIVARLHQPGDPEFTFVFVNSPKQNARVLGDATRATIQFHKGLLNLLDDVDEIAAVIAHEMHHTVTFATLTRGERWVQKSREELITADLGGIERMTRAGFDPRAYLRLLQKLSRGEERHSGFIVGFFSSHPDYKLRISAAAAKLVELEEEMEFPPSQPLDEVLLQLKATQASQGYFPRFERVPDPVKPTSKPIQEDTPEPEIVHFNARAIYDQAVQDPAYRALSDEQKVQVLGDLGSYCWVEEKDSHVRGHIAPSRMQRMIHVQSRMGEPLDFAGYLEHAYWLPHDADYRTERDRSVSRDTLAEILRIAEASSDPEVKLRAAETILRMNPQDYWEEDSLCKRLPEAAERAFPIPDFADLAAFETFERIHLIPQGSSHKYNDGFLRWLNEKILARLFAKAQTPVEIVAVGRRVIQERFYDGRILATLFEDFYWAGWRLEQHDIVYGEVGVKVASREARERIALDPRLTRAQRLYFARNAELAGEFFNRLLLAEIASVADFFRVRAELEALPDANAYLNLTGKDLKTVLDGHPEWTLGIEDVIAVGNWDSVDYHNGYWRTSENKRWREAYGRPDGKYRNGIYDWLGRKGEHGLATTFWSASHDQDRGPAYDFDLSRATERQRDLLGRLCQAGNFPADPREEHRLLMALAKHGATYDSDEWAARLYLNDRFSDAALLEEALHARVVWDFSYRKQMYDKYKTLMGYRTRLPTDHARAIGEELIRVNQYFPEESAARAQVLEDFTQELRANYEETRRLESAKSGRDENDEALALRVFNGILGELEQDRGRHIQADWNVLRERETQYQQQYQLALKERQLQFIRFLVGKGPLPDDLKPAVDSTIGEDRLKRQFQALTPEMRVRLVDPLLRTDTGLYADPQCRARLIDLALEGVEKEREEARLVLNGVLYALHQTAPHAETFTLAFIVCQLGDRATTPGQRLRAALESLGITGVSIAQKIYQRRLLPPEYLSDLADLQDQARPLRRLQIFEMMAQRLEIPAERLDDTVILEDILGSASSKVVVKVGYLDGRLPPDERRALKMLRANFVRSTELEIAKVNHLIGYLEREGGPKYRRLRSAFHAVERSLRLQADVLAESRVTERVKALYDRAAVMAASGFRFVVVEPDLILSFSPLHVHETVAPGMALKSLQGQQKALAFGAIYMMEEAIHFDPDDPEADVTYERDRHGGNFNAQFAENGDQVIYVYDYPLLGQISKKQRVGILKTLGLLSETGKRRGLLGRGLRCEISRIVVEDLCVGMEEQAKASLRKTIELGLKDIAAAHDKEITGLMLDLLAIVEDAGSEIDPNIYDYLIALGHMEFYAGKPEGEAENVFRRRLRRDIEELLAPLRQDSTLTGMLRNGLKVLFPDWF